MQADIKDTWYVIVNPVAGFGRGLGDLPHITKLIRENENTPCSEEALALARRIIGYEEESIERLKEFL